MVMAKGLCVFCQKRDKRRTLHLASLDEKAIVDSIRNRVTFSFSRSLFRSCFSHYGVTLFSGRGIALFPFSPNIAFQFPPLAGRD